MQSRTHHQAAQATHASTPSSRKKGCNVWIRELPLTSSPQHQMGTFPKRFVIMRQVAQQRAWRVEVVCSACRSLSSCERHSTLAWLLPLVTRFRKTLQLLASESSGYKSHRAAGRCPMPTGSGVGRSVPSALARKSSRYHLVARIRYFSRIGASFGHARARTSRTSCFR